MLNASLGTPTLPVRRIIPESFFGNCFGSLESVRIRVSSGRNFEGKFLPKKEDHHNLMGSTRHFQAHHPETFRKIDSDPGPIVEETGGRKILTENKRCQKLEKAAAVRAEMIPQFLQLYAATESGCVIKHDSRQNFV